MKINTRLKKHLKGIIETSAYNKFNENENIPKNRLSSYGKSGYLSIIYKKHQYKILRSYNTLVCIFDYTTNTYYFKNNWSNTTHTHIKTFINNDQLYYQLKKKFKHEN